MKRIRSVIAIFGAIVGAIFIGVCMGFQSLSNGGLAGYLGSFQLVTFYSLSVSTLFIAMVSWRQRHEVMQLLRSKEVSGWRKLLSGAPGAVFLSIFAFMSLFVTGPAAAGFGIVVGMVVPGFVAKWYRDRTVPSIDLRGFGLILLGGLLVALARGEAGLPLGDVAFLFGWLVVAVVSACVAWQFDTLGAMTRAVQSVRASSLVSSATGAMWAFALVIAIAVTMQELPIPADASLPTNPLYYMGPIAALGIIPIGAWVAPILGPVVKPILTNAGIILMTGFWELSTVPHTPLSKGLLFLAMLCAVFIAVDRVIESRRLAAGAAPEPVPVTSLVLARVGGALSRRFYERGRHPSLSNYFYYIYEPT